MLRLRCTLLLLCAFASCCAAPLSRCRLAVVGAGTPRTGSTHEIRLARLALERLNMSDHVVDAGYWKWPMHSRMPAAEAESYTADEKARWAAWDNETVVIYKSHEYDKELLNLCARSVVLLTHAGCIETAVRSAVAARFIAANRDAIIGHLDIMLRDYSAWKRHATLDLPSDALRGVAGLHAAALVHHTIAAVLQVPYVVHDFSSERDRLAAESNPDIPRSGGGHVNAVTAEDALVREVLSGAAQQHFKDDERLIGWTWTCQ